MSAQPDDIADNIISALIEWRDAIKALDAAFASDPKYEKMFHPELKRTDEAAKRLLAAIEGLQ